MIELPKEQYSQAGYLLEYAVGDKVFAHSIIEKRQTGIVYVDSQSEISNAFFWHKCGFGILVGKEACDNSIATVLKLLDEKHPDSGKGLVLQSLDLGYDHLFQKKLPNDNSIRTGTRLIFRFNRSRFSPRLFPIPRNYRVVPIDGERYQQLNGNIIPGFAWKTPEEFISNGIGFCLMREDSVLCTAFSCFIGNGQMDIGVETPPKYRKHGYAKWIVAKLISHCLENNIEPIWGCIKENIPSRKLAMALGFETVGENRYYYKLTR